MTTSGSSGHNRNISVASSVREVISIGRGQAWLGNGLLALFACFDLSFSKILWDWSLVALIVTNETRLTVQEVVLYTGAENGGQIDR